MGLGAALQTGGGGEVVLMVEAATKNMDISQRYKSNDRKQDELVKREIVESNKGEGRNGIEGKDIMQLSKKR